MNKTPSSKFVSPKLIREKYGVSVSTLRNWADEGKIETVRTPGGSRRYNSDQVDQLFLDKTKPRPPGNNRKRILYARVSSAHQRADLERQQDDLVKVYPDDELISDIGSGLNWKRPGFTRILDSILAGEVAEIVVTHRDRLCRFALELVEHIMDKHNAKLMVLRRPSNPEEQSATNELAEDLLSIVNVFVARNNGLRAGRNRRIRKEQQQEEAASRGASTTDQEEEEQRQDSGSESDQNYVEANHGTKRNLEEMDGNSEMDIQPVSQSSKRRC